MEFLGSEQSLFTLFLLSFLASTIIPLGSEWLLGALVLDGNHASTALILIATTGNYLGGCTTYLLGRWGSDLLIFRLLRMKPADAQRASAAYRRWGVWSLLFTWLPLVGDPLCLAAGIFGTKFTLFSILVFTGKLLRYCVVVWALNVAVTA